ncbi:unnamed protein product [Pelagomonas calceolata]|uniref:Uncharacterized protein n=1 Tax=Pelagomonas calceolata TaxID=35677 RepID=A0A6S8RI21_9STRA|nr:unnamed protein product [Pelagomonas calceolata]|mmetsp:Transcript_20733/g.58617  ORF Transcript_20733/g.58617 Transcript_20733/m.58617 type:complete len:258 (-) Transcript_20733:62-835(-)
MTPTRHQALLAVLAAATALSPTRRAALKAKKEVPVFDANAYKRKYYANFAEAKWRQRNELATATTRQAVIPEPVERPQLGDLFAMDPNVEEPVGWRDLFVTKTVPIKYRKRQELKRAFYKAAEREHGRAALLGAAFISSVAWDARLGPLVLFARCGCPQALNQFAEGAPNVLIEGPLAAMSLAYLVRELHRSFNPVGVEMRDLDASQQKARGLSLRAELFQGRVAMLGTAAVVLLAGPQHTVSEAVGDVVDAVVGTL